jgi:Spy/CpxP family protein refolding chaperone
MKRISNLGFRISNFGFGVLLAVAAPGVVAGQAKSAYSGEERREIKALSPQEIHSYRIGEGMGLGKAAELNHYPGPKHVLGLARELGLSADQIARSEQIRARMLGEAVRLGNAIVEKEGALDRLFAGGTATGETLAKATKEIAALQGELRAVHLMAHIEMKQVLTPAQIALFDTLRGYASAQHEHHH